MNEEVTTLNEVETSTNDSNSGDFLKTVKKHFSKLGLAFFIGSIIIYAVQMLTSIIVAYFIPDYIENNNLYLTFSMVPMYLIGMPIMIFLISRIEKTTPQRKKLSAGQYFKAIVISIATLEISNLLGSIVTSAIGIIKGSEVNNVVATVTTDLNPLLALLYMVLCAPVMEEMIFRKLLVDRTIKYGEGVAILLSGLFFGLFHGNLNQFAYAFCLGIVFAYIYAETGNVKYTIGLHMIVNFIGSVAIVYIWKLIDLEAFQEASNAGVEALTSYYSENPEIFIYLLYIMLILAAIITGVVFFILFIVQDMTGLKKGEVVIPKGKRFNTIILNLGIILFILFWLVQIICQLAM